MVGDNPDLALVLAHKYQQGTVSTTSRLTLFSNGGTAFVSFAKTADFNAGTSSIETRRAASASVADLYDDLVAPALSASLFVETWRRGSPVPLDCSRPQIVLDVQNLNVAGATAFHYTLDHSKFAVASTSTTPYVCIGDINRMVKGNFDNFVHAKMSSSMHCRHRNLSAAAAPFVLTTSLYGRRTKTPLSIRINVELKNYFQSFSSRIFLPKNH